MKQGRFQYFSPDELEAIRISLSCRINLIETGSVNVGAEDLVNLSDEIRKSYGAELRALSTEQMKLVVMMRGLWEETL